MVSEIIPSFRKLPLSFESKKYSLTQVDCVNFTDPVLSPSSQGGGLVGDQCVGLVRPKLLSELPPRTNRLWRVGRKGFFGSKGYYLGNPLSLGGGFDKLPFICRIIIVLLFIITANSELPGFFIVVFIIAMIMINDHH